MSLLIFLWVTLALDAIGVVYLLNQKDNANAIFALVMCAWNVALLAGIGHGYW